MIAAKPRHFVNRGSVLASAFMIHVDTLGLTEARKRVLSVWQPGLGVKQVGDAFIVLLSSPLRVNAEQAIGEPLVKHGRLLIALPLEADEVDELAPAGDSVVFARAGKLRTIALAEMPEQDIAQWIDASSVTLAEVVSLGKPPESPAFQAAEFDPRRNIPGVPPASTVLQNLLKELRGPQGVKVAHTPGTFRPFQWLRRQLLRLLSWKSALIQTPAAAQQKERSAATRRAKRVWDWLTTRGNRFLSFTRLWRLMSSRHARYLARMMEMMQSGDLDEGLRHAIPLADATNIAKQSRSWFGTPQRRSSLRIDPYRQAARSTLVADSGLYTHLHNLYRQAFKRLEAQGRIEEAAFVLTDLLAQHAEAVSFLEKHGRLRLAAEIAEARKLSPALAIRLWWLAKERKRAITLACRTGEFERAIQCLSAGHPQEADKLRLAWAERLAASGKYAAAAEAIWPVTADRHIAARYLDQAIELGGTSGAIALARKSARFPHSFEEVLLRVQTLMADETDEAARARRAFAESLRNEPRTPESQLLARLAVRALVRDVQLGMVELAPAQLRRLVDYTADSCLRTDVPPMEALKPKQRNLPPAFSGVVIGAGTLAALRRRVEPDPAEMRPRLEHAANSHGGADVAMPAGTIEIAASDVGSRAVSDVALLPDGRLLLALGEAGLLVLSREGEVVAQLNEPAHRLVISDDGSRAIGIAPRGSICRLVRIDVLTRTASYWCDTTITAYTSDFDGSVWCVGNGEDVFLIDTLAQSFEALWRIPELGGFVCAMQRNRKKSQLHVVTANRKQLTLWTYEQPSCILRSKQEFTAELTQAEPFRSEINAPAVFMREAVTVSEEGDIYEQIAVHRKSANDQSVVCQVRAHPSPGTRHRLVEGEISGSLRHAAAQEPWMCMPVQRESGIEVDLLETRSGKVVSILRLHGSKHVSVRFQDNLLLCADDQGRILALNILSRRSVRDLRI
jgi:hypothetical protein